DTPEWLDNIADLANFYLDFLDQLDLRGVHLVGSSLGGWIAAELAVRNATRLASLTLIGAAGIHVDGVAQVDTFLTNEEQRIRDLFYDQELAEAVIAGSQRPELEDAALKNRMMTAKDRKSTRLNSSHVAISYAVFCSLHTPPLHSFPTRRSSDLLTLIGAAGIHVDGVAQVDTFLTNEEQRIRDLFYDQELAEAVIAGSQRPELEDAALKNRMMTA